MRVVENSVGQIVEGRLAEVVKNNKNTTMFIDSGEEAGVACAAIIGFHQAFARFQSKYFSKNQETEFLKINSKLNSLAKDALDATRSMGY